MFYFLLKLNLMYDTIFCIFSDIYYIFSFKKNDTTFLEELITILVNRTDFCFSPFQVYN